MGPAYMNYIGSLVFGALALIFLFSFFRLNQDRLAMLLTILAGAAGWVSCYAGVLIEVNPAWLYTSIAAAAFASFLTLALCVFAIRTFLHA